MSHLSMKRSILSSAVAAVLGTMYVGSALAQDEPDEIVVTGIKASLTRSMDIKQNSVGVVDAISAEDMGKFPDTNLAESLQRITGVSISRSNGEGSKVTVRGFGDDYNLITLNGRSMPGASAPIAGNAAPSSRSFDFANIASEGVNGVEVYKTGKANISSGGIGATINIKTARPFDHEGFKASVGGKIVNDTTNEAGSDFTPEVSGLFSWTNDSSNFGVGVTASHQERDSGDNGAFVSNWNSTRAWQTPSTNANGAFLGAAITNPPAQGQLFSTPTDIRYYHADTSRTRDNAQLVMQFKPSDNLIGTLDYTYAKNSSETSRGEQSLWFVNSAASATFDNASVRTPVLYAENTGAGKDFGLATQHGGQINDLKSLGLNLAWAVNDKLKLTLDAHDSKANSLPNTADGYSWVNVGMAAPVIGKQMVDFRGELPAMTITAFDDNRSGTNQNGKLDIDDVSTQVMQMSTTKQMTEIKEVKIDGDWDLDTGSFQFGVESRSTESHGQGYASYDPFGDWGINNPGDIPNELLKPYDFTKNLGDYNTSASVKTAFTGDAVAIGKWASQKYGRTFAGRTTNFDNDATVKEDVTAAYFQVKLDGELGGMKTHTLAGVRYENTDVTSSVQLVKPTSITWLSNNDFQVNKDNKATPFGSNASYSHLLPNLDFDIQLTDSLKGRVSFSKTIARATYNNLSGAVVVNNPSGPTTAGLVSATANENGNAGLLPLESANFDASIEWYYSDSNYMSFGVWEKRVANFIGSETTSKSLFDLRDPTAGPRARAAIAALQSLGQPTDENRLYTMTALIDNNRQADYKDTQAFRDEIERTYDVNATAADPLYMFSSTHPVNNREAKIHGFEAAIQHFFGETGFGVSANYTKVLGDISYNVNGDPTVNQFALLGLSDTANGSLIYENSGIQARISYNWRAEYLAGAGTTPTFVEPYSQIDFNLSYAVTENLTLSLEGLNVTEENARLHARTSRQFVSLQDLGARYNLGARYTF